MPRQGGIATDDAQRHGSLSHRIFVDMAIFAVVATVIFAVATTTFFYFEYENDAEDYLVDQAREVAAQIDDLDVDEAIAYLESHPLASARCTLIESDGTVLYDSEADAGTLANHSDRTEFQDARDTGEATVVRYSETLEADTIYAADLLDSGNVIRLAETRHSLASFLTSMLPPMAIFAALIIVLTFGLSRMLTRKIMRPIDDLDLSDPAGGNEAYAEMQPLLARIDEQQALLKQQNKELEIAVETRREFSANVSHEMKTPLQVIGGYAELIEAGVTDPDDTVRFAGVIRNEADSMRALIDDVLTLSRLDESSLGQAEISDVDLVALSERVIDRLDAVAGERKVTVSLVPGAKRMVVRGSETLLEETLYNLVDNAIRYNHPGGNVWVSFEETEDRRAFRVTDTGPGIPSEMREKVFERFYRLEQGRSRETGGTGLGLAIVKHAVQRYGGAVSIEDVPGGGSSFVVELPPTAEAEADQPNAALPDEAARQ